MPSLVAALDLPPAEAVAFFEANGEAVTWDWHELLRQQHGQVFTVAKATSLDVLRAIRDQVSKAVGDGQTFESFKRNLKPQLQALGWWGKQEVLDANTGELTAAQLGSDRRLRTIFQTNVQTAYMAGRFQRLVGNAGDRPFWMYVAVMDGRTRPAHAALNGKVFRWDDPIWRVIFPPNGWGCRCRVRALTAAEVEQMGLSVENGADRIVSKEVQLGKDGPTVTVQGISGVGSRGTETFWPDPGWDYNPGLQVDQDQAISAVLADKVVQVPAPIGAEAAQAILADDSAAQLLDRAWQGWVDEVTSDPAVRGRTQVLGYLRKSDAVAAFAKVPDMSAAISVADAMVLSATKAAGSKITRQTLDGLSSAMRSPVAVLWDKARSAMVYVTAAEAGRLTLITLGSRPARIAAEALVQSIASMSQAELQAAVGAGLFEVMEGAV